MTTLLYCFLGEYRLKPTSLMTLLVTVLGTQFKTIDTCLPERSPLKSSKKEEKGSQVNSPQVGSTAPEALMSTTTGCRRAPGLVGVAQPLLHLMHLVFSSSHIRIQPGQAEPTPSPAPWRASWLLQKNLTVNSLLQSDPWRGQWPRHFRFVESQMSLGKCTIHTWT